MAYAYLSMTANIALHHHLTTSRADAPNQCFVPGCFNVEYIFHHGWINVQGIFLWCFNIVVCVPHFKSRVGDRPDILNTQQALPVEDAQEVRNGEIGTAPSVAVALVGGEVGFDDRCASPFCRIYGYWFAVDAIRQHQFSDARQMRMYGHFAGHFLTA